jgi:hypothetical protein
MGRELISTFVAVLCALAFCSNRVLRLDSMRVAYLILPAAMAVAGVLTGLTNGDVLIYGNRVLPRLSPVEGISFGISQLLTYGLPFALGLTLVRSREDLLRILMVLAWSGLAYTVLCLFELRMSPILHKLIYGHHARSEFDFSIAMRGTGYRPTVFMVAPLDLGLFMAVCGLAAVGLWRAGLKRFGPVPAIAGTGWILLIVALCKCLAAFIYSAFAAPLLGFMSGRFVIRVATVMAIAAMSYPALRASALFPTESLVNTASMVSEERALSLSIRFANEELVLTKAAERPLFGWGTYARWRTYNDDGGFADSIDGLWLVILGSSGGAGLVFSLALLLLPVLQCYLSAKRIRSPQDCSLAGVMAMIIALNGIDLLPNAFLHSYVLFMAGGLASALPALCAAPRVRQQVRSPVASLRPAPAA